MGFDDEVGPPERFEPTRLPRTPVSEIDLAASGHPHGHLGDRLPARPPLGRPAGVRPPGPDPPRGGVVDDAPGIYVLGLNVLRRRRSTYIGGAAGDTAELADHLHRHLDKTANTRPASMVGAGPS